MKTLTTPEELEKEYGVRILPARIIGGRRWEFAGKSVGNIPPGQTMRIEINSSKGVIVYNWHVLDSRKQKELTEHIMEVFKK